MFLCGRPNREPRSALVKFVDALGGIVINLCSLEESIRGYQFSRV